MDTSTLGVWSGKIVVVDPFAPPEPWWEEPAEVVEAWDAMERYYEDHPEALADEESFHDYRSREEQVTLL